MPSSRRTPRRREPCGRIWNPPLHNQRRARGQPGNRCPCVIINFCRGRCSHRPGGPYAARTPAGGINPAPTNKLVLWTNRDGSAHPGGRRAGCPHPAAPRAAANPAGGYGIRPYTTNGGRAANREIANPALHQTPVGDDARTAPAGAFRRPTGPRSGSWAGDRPGDLTPRERPRVG